MCGTAQGDINCSSLPAGLLQWQKYFWCFDERFWNSSQSVFPIAHKFELEDLFKPGMKIFWKIQKKSVSLILAICKTFARTMISWKCMKCALCVAICMFSPQQNAQSSTSCSIFLDHLLFTLIPILIFLLLLIIIAIPILVKEELL